MIEESTEAVLPGLLFVVPALIAGFAILNWWLVGRALRPVHAITNQVQAISSSNLDRRVPVPKGSDEVAELALVMNQMLQRLEIGDERQRQFSADASHELRSPLSTVRIAAELIARSSKPDQAASLADEIVAEADRMDELIGDMLELSHLNEDGQRAKHEDFDVVALIGETIGDGRAASSLNGPTASSPRVTVHAPPTLVVNAVPGQLSRVFRNLVDNALRHGRKRVEITVEAKEDRFLVAVDDDGNGVPPEERDRVFERFARLDEARNRDEGGAGLGLALVKAVSDRHQGLSWVEDSKLGGARFVIDLPR